MIPSLQSRVMPWALPFVTNFWDARTGISQGTATERVSAWADRVAGTSLAQGTAANQPILLPYSGTNYLWLPGVNGNYASAPDAAPLDIAGDIDLRCWLSMDNWSLAAFNRLICKYDGGTMSYILDILSGSLRFSYSPDGSAARTATSSVTLGFTNFTAKWVRATYASATGKVNFYSSDDGSTWTPIGTEQTITAGSIFNSTIPLAIGSQSGGTGAGFSAKVYRAQIYNGIAGTLAFDANFTTVSEGAASFTESSSNGATVTINSTGSKPAQIVGSQKILTDGAAHFLQGTFTNNAPYTPGGVFRPSTWVSGAVFFDGKTANSFALQQITGTPQMRLHDGTLNGATVSPTLGTKYVVTAVQDAAGAASLGLNLATRTADTLSHTAMAGLTMGADGSGANFSAGIWDCLFLCNTALSTAQLQQLINSINSQYWVF